MSNKDKSKKGIIITIAVVLFLLLAFLITKTIINNNKEKINNAIDIQEVVSDKTNEENNNNESSTKDKELVVELEEDESFLITFALNDGTILQSTFVKKGELPVYVGAIPVIEGYKFIGWNKSIKKVSESTTYYARFEKVEEEIPPKPTVYYTITVEIKNGDEDKCADTEQNRFGSRRCAAGSVVEIYANPIEGYATVWQDGNTSNPRSIIVTKDETYTAHFETGFNLTYNDYLDGEKTVRIKENETVNIVLKDTSSISGAKSITVIGDMNLNVDNYNIVNDTAEYTFIGYKYNNQVSPKTLTAQYKDKVTINTSVNNENYGVSYTTTDGDDYSTDKQSKFYYYDKGDDVYICAKPKSNEYDFVKWSDGNTSNPRKIVADSNKTYQAIFENGYDYMNFINTSTNNGVVSMYINGFDSDVYHVRTKLDSDNGKDTLVIDKYGNVCVDDDGNDLDKNKLPDGFNNDGSKHVTITVPELLLEYRVDKYDNSSSSYNIGFWDDFNLSEDDLEQGETINDDNCYKNIDIGPNDRINIRAKKTQNGYVSRSIAGFSDNPTHGLQGEEYYLIEEKAKDGGGTEEKKVGISICIGSHLFDLKDKIKDSLTTYKVSGSITSILDGVGKHYNDINNINGGNKSDHYFTYAALFAASTKLTDISEFKLNADNTTLGCYYALFENTMITGIPGIFNGYPQEGQQDANSYFLPADNLTNSCYAYMFNNCDGLEDLSNFVLPAKNINGRCYFCMFEGCDKLKTINENIVANCLYLMDYEKYNDMLEFAVENPTHENLKAFNDFAMTQAKCYYSMFKNCVNLVTIPKLPAIVIEPYCYESMFANCYNLNNNGSNQPDNMEVILPAYFLYDYCYAHMFDCKDIKRSSYINKVTLGCYSIGLNRNRIESQTDDYFESINSCTGFLGSVNEEDSKFYGAYASGTLVTTQYVDKAKCYFFINQNFNSWVFQNDYPFPDEYVPASTTNSLMLNTNFDICSNELLEDKIDYIDEKLDVDNENLSDINEDVTQKNPEQNIEEIIETDDDKKELNEDEINDDAIPIEHKDNDINPLDELEA